MRFNFRTKQKMTHLRTTWLRTNSGSCAISRTHPRVLSVVIAGAYGTNVCVFQEILKFVDLLLINACANVLCSHIQFCFSITSQQAINFPSRN